jgi:type II secretory pathway component PulM
MNRNRESSYAAPARTGSAPSGSAVPLLLRAFRQSCVAMQWPSLRARWSRASPFARDITLVLVLKLVLLVILWAAFFRDPAVPRAADAKAQLATERLLGSDPAPARPHADR